MEPGSVIGQTFSHYRVVDQLGSGGMGVVYLAEDLRLGRVVALKFLSPECGRDPEALARFNDEARAASALDHPNICTIHDIGEWSDGRPFIAMTYYDGLTLKQRLMDGPIPLPEAVKVARQIADALSQAHQHGIVHRDIKPANLIVTRDDVVKLVDFGVAKLADSPSLTRTGASVGTPAYMSPEQAAGGEGDKQSDLWALGAVLYEMIAGKPPFAGQSAAAVLGAIVHEEPASLTVLRPGVPAVVASIVRRLLAKRRSDRYATAAEVSEDLRAAERALLADPTPPAVSSRAVPARRATPLLIAALILVGLLGALSLARFGSSRATTEIPATADAPGVGSSRTDTRARIAVLPFDNLGAPDDAYFADGITEEITSRLSSVKRLAVISRSSATQYDRRGKTLRQLGGDLGVDYVLEGTVRWARGSQGSQVRISPQLVRVSDDTNVWSHRYDATLDDVFKVQSDIAHQVIASLQVALEANERRSLDAHRTGDNEAYLAYLRGLTAFQRGSSDTSNQAVARSELERAVERDQGFSLAWAWLSRVYASQYGTGAYRAPETLELARRAARKALDLDPTLPEAHMAQAYVHEVGRDYAAGLGEVEIARAGLPSSSELLVLTGNIERRRGRWAESLAANTRALELDPRYVSAALATAIHHMTMRQYPEALRFVRLARAADPSASTAVPEAWVLFSGMQDLDGARRVLASASLDDARVRALLARLELFDGRYERALELIRGLPAAGAWMPANFRFPAAIAEAQVYDAMGRTNEAKDRYRAAVAVLEARSRGGEEDYQIEGSLGLAYAGLGRAGEAVRHGQRAAELLPLEKDAHEGPLYLYLLAQIHTRLGQYPAALARLEEVLRVPGFYNTTWIERDPGFAALREQPRYRELIGKWDAAR